MQGWQSVQGCFLFWEIYQLPRAGDEHPELICSSRLPSFYSKVTSTVVPAWLKSAKNNGHHAYNVVIALPTHPHVCLKAVHLRFDAQTKVEIFLMINYDVSCFVAVLILVLKLDCNFLTHALWQWRKIRMSLVLVNHSHGRVHWRVGKGK